MQRRLKNMIKKLFGTAVTVAAIAAGVKIVKDILDNAEQAEKKMIELEPDEQAEKPTDEEKES
jgi:hypothetical protein